MEPAQRGEQYSIKLQMKALYVNRSSVAKEGLCTMEATKLLLQTDLLSAVALVILINFGITKKCHDNKLSINN